MFLTTLNGLEAAFEHELQMAGATVEGAELRFPVFAPEDLIGVMETVSLDVQYVALDPDSPSGRCGASSGSGLTWRNSSAELKACVQRSISRGRGRTAFLQILFLSFFIRVFFIRVRGRRVLGSSA